MNKELATLNSLLFEDIKITIHANNLPRSSAAGGEAKDGAAIVMSDTVTSFAINLDGKLLHGETTEKDFLKLNGTTVIINRASPPGATAVIGAENQDKTYRTVTVKKNTDGTYKLIYNTSGTLESEKNTEEFYDVSKADWYYDSVMYMKKNGLMSGVSDTSFVPDAYLTRGMLMTVLWRIEGQPLCPESEFDDVEKNIWYSKGIAWAADKRIVEGTGNNKFSPDSYITREQLATVIHRYAIYKGRNEGVKESVNLREFWDFNSISEYAVSSMQYAVDNGILRGKTANTLNPLDCATRAETAAVLCKLLEIIE